MSNEIRNRKNKDQNDSDDSLDDDELAEISKDINVDKENYQPPIPATRWAKIKMTLREWGLSCSWHGIPHIAQSIAFVSIMLWSVALLICAVLFIYLLVNTIRQYFSYLKVVDLNIGMDLSLFPSITFCNSNPYKLSAVQSIPELEALLSIYSVAQ